MNKTLKWILIGLGIALVVFFIAMSIFMFLGRGAGAAYEPGSWGKIPYGGMMPYARGGYHMPFIGMLGGFGLFRMLLPLAVIGFAVYGVVRLVSGKNGHHNAESTPTPPAVGAAERVCTACGRPLPDVGEYCPHCGTKQ